MPPASRYKRPLFVLVLAVAVAAAALVFFWRSSPQRNNLEEGQMLQTSIEKKAKGAGDNVQVHGSAGLVRKALHAADGEPNTKYLAERDLASFVRNYPAFVEAATRGDASAARELYENLSTCRSAPRSMAKIDDELGQIALDSGVTSKAYAAAQASLTKQFQDCGQLTDAQIASYRHWLSEAARLGDAKSKLVYVRSGQPDNPDSPTFLRDSREFQETARAYLTEQLALNNPDALFTASISHARGGILETNPVDEYAYLYAYVLAKGIKNGVLLDRLTEMGAGMTDENVAAATSKGGALYRACCQ